MSEAIRQLAGDNCEKYAERLHKIAMGAIEPRDSIRAIEALLLRAIGKPTEHVIVENDQPELTDEQYRQALIDNAREYLAGLTPAERESLLKQPTIAGAPGTETLQ